MMCKKRIKAVKTSVLIVVYVFLSTVFTYASSPIKSFEYYINDNNQAILTKYVGTDSNVVVPAEIDGYKVFSTEETFYENEFIESVEFSNGIKEIGHHTFVRCRNLKKVKIADTVSSLGQYAFRESAVEKIKLPGSVRDVGMACFLGCADLIFVKANAKELDIALYAFNGSGIKVLQVSEFSGLQLGDSAIPDDCAITDNFVGSFIHLHNNLFSSLDSITPESYWIRFLSLFLMLTLLTIVVLAIIKVVSLIISELNGKEESTYNKYIRTSSKAIVSLNNNNYSYLKYGNINRSKFKRGIKYTTITELVLGLICAIVSALFPFYLNIGSKLHGKNIYFLVRLFGAIILMIIAIILPIALLYLTIKVMLFIRSIIFASAPNMNAQIKKIKEDKDDK